MENRTPLVTVRLAEPILTCLRRFADVPECLELPLAGQAGSGRKYYRIGLAGRTWILQISHSQDADFKRFVEYCQVFSVLGMPTPHIHAVDEQKWQVLLDDLGTQQLWDRCPQGNADEMQDLYQRVLGELSRWQSASRAAFLASEDLRSRHFDTHALRWETEYFTEHYLQAYQAIAPQKIERLLPWFDRLAQRVANHPRGLMHRDFQSQNVMVNETGRIGFVDFQGARDGSLYYDAASLLWDPYVELSEENVHDWFIVWSQNNPNLQGDEALHWPRFLEASLQRLMQALGAYCNLSRNKGLPQFAKHIAPGSYKLRQALRMYARNSLPEDADAAYLLISILGSPTPNP